MRGVHVGARAADQASAAVVAGTVGAGSNESFTDATAPVPRVDGEHAELRLAVDGKLGVAAARPAERHRSCWMCMRSFVGKRHEQVRVLGPRCRVAKRADVVDVTGEEAVTAVRSDRQLADRVVLTWLGESDDESCGHRSRE